MLKNSFSHRIVDSWNTLPCETRYASSEDIFKSKVVIFFKGGFYLKFGSKEGFLVFLRKCEVQLFDFTSANIFSE